MSEAAAKPARDLRLDFFRGLSLFFIFVDHIPNNIASYVTLRSFALSDAADVFIFISGYTAALVYGRAIGRDGVLLTSARIYRRAWQLYVAHLCVFLLYSAEVAYTVDHFNNPMFADELGAGDFLIHPEMTLIRVLTLQFQPALLDILPLYIALLVAFPLFLLAMRRHALLALVPSLLLWGAVHLWGINLPGYPEGRNWFFNPFAWQLLFVLGALFGYHAGQGRALVPTPRWSIWLAGTIAIAAMLIELSWTWHDVFAWIPTILHRALWPVEKSTLPLLRVVNMLALALLAATLVPREARFMHGRIGWLIVLCGRRSLEIFCLTIVLSMLGTIVLSVVGNAVPAQLAVDLAGTAAMLGLGLLMAWFDGGGHLPSRHGMEKGAG
ncbi:MAG: OpgC domain-containing protein [Rhodospirillales bacterium]|nr:OpgC domain-containing protein [Rhodospirillales bacterium]MDE2200430.1 OpgC domain-containing protein [Rhodospirillales bacterium]MDE2575469.1 OpgC domain-containing protein [Rhodospirillales bacterium]